MRKLFLILFVFFTLQVSATKYYVATDGSDANPGTIGSPFATWGKLNDVLTAGDTAYIRGGSYERFGTGIFQVRWNALNGTSDDTIKIWNYPGEHPILDLEGENFGTATRYMIQMNQCNYVWVKGLRVTNAAQPGTSPIIAFNIINSNNCVIENITVDHIGGQGFKVCDEGWGMGDNNVETTFNILFLNCDAWACDDPTSPTPYDGADGFGINHNTEDAISRNNWVKDITFRGCRSYFNSDDGFDFFRCDSTGIVLQNCWSFFNGKSHVDTSNTGNGQGFKLGPNGIPKVSELQMTIVNCIAAKNRGNGFDQNSTNYSSIKRFYNNLAYANVVGYAYNYYTWYPAIERPANVFRNNIAYDNTYNYGFEAQCVVDHNSWQDVTLTSADFQSLQYTQLFNPRKSNGDLPDITFGHLAEGSDLIEAGVDVGWPFDGTAPDIGVYWSYDGSEDPAPTPDIPVVTTTEIISYNVRYATGAGNVTSDGGGTITSRGVCWSTSANPTTADSKFTSGGTTGAFSGRLYPLKANTTYHYRSFATNSSGTSYGADQTFTTPVQSVNMVGSQYLYHGTQKVISK